MIGVTISITDVRIFLHRISLLTRRSKAALLHMAVFHFVLGICKVTVKNQTIFTKEQKMRLIISWKKTGGESEADWVNKLFSTSERKHLPVLFTYALAILKSGRPFTDFEFVITLDKAKGVEVAINTSI